MKPEARRKEKKYIVVEEGTYLRTTVRSMDCGLLSFYSQQQGKELARSVRL